MVSACDLLTGPFTRIAVDQHLRQRLYGHMVRPGDNLDCAFNAPSDISRNGLDPVACATDQGTSNTLAGAGSALTQNWLIKPIISPRSVAKRERVFSRLPRLIAAHSTIMRLVASKPFGRVNEVFPPFREDQRRFNAMDSSSRFAGGKSVLGDMVTLQIDCGRIRARDCQYCRCIV
jgi:hypothetical protein